MAEHAFYSEDYMEGADSEKNRLLQYIIELERELMRMKRAEKILREVEQRYLALMDSTVFLCVILAPDGKFRAMNRRAEEFFGFQMKFGTDVTLQSLSGPGYMGEIESMLKEAMDKPLHATLPVIRTESDMCWLDMECTNAIYQGDTSIHIIASDITCLMKGKTDESLISDELEPSPAYAMQALGSCPGLLCFVVDKSGILLYSTRGYKEVAKRFLGHECTPGFPYPVNIDTPFDLDLQDMIQEAFLGNTAKASLVETGGNNNKWDVTGAPLLSSVGAIVGAIVNLTSASDRADLEHPQFLPKPKVDESGSGVLAAAGVELLDSIPRMLLVVDDNTLCVEANANFLSVLKLERGTIVGRRLEGLLLEGDPINENFTARFAQAVREKSFEDLECKAASKDGDVLSLSLSGTRMQWNGEGRTLVSCVDNTKLRRTEEQLKRVSTTDASTGSLNRQGMERVLGTEMERAVRYRGSLAMIMLDVDGFRQLNERLGYSASDKILKDLAAAIKSRIRLTDFLGRWGGDEFIILTPLPIATAIQLAEKLRDMAQHTTFGDNSHLTISAGVAEFNKSMDVSSFVGAAYDAMIEAKKGGGNRTVQGKESEAQLD